MKKTFAVFTLAFASFAFAAPQSEPIKAQPHFLAVAEQPKLAPALDLFLIQPAVAKKAKPSDKLAVCDFNWDTFEWECSPDPEPEPDCTAHPELCY